MGRIPTRLLHAATIPRSSWQMPSNAPAPRMGQKVREALAATKDFNAVTGNITINEQRDATKSAVILQVKDGKFKYLETVSP